MIVVCDTGPLTPLWQIGLWPAFVVFDETHLPVQVVDEVQRHVDLDQLQSFTRLQIHTVSPTQVETVRRAQPQGTHLQVTDLAVLALAQTLTHDLVLTDDLNLRRALEGQHLRPMGSIGVLVSAYKTSLIDRGQLDEAIEKLFVQSTLYLSPQFKSYVRHLIDARLDDSV